MSGNAGGGYPEICPDGSGGAFIGWDGFLAGVDTDTNEYCQHLLSTGAIAPQFSPNGVRACAAPNRQYMAQVLQDGSGGWFAIWIDFRNASQTGYDLYAQHILPAGATDPSWPADGAVVSASAGDQWFPYGIADGAGGLFVVWDDQRAATEDVYGIHLTASGQTAPGWPINGRPLFGPPAVRILGSATSDGSGGVLVVWGLQSPTGYHGLITQCQRLDADGNPNPAWPAGGLFVTSARVDRGIAPDGAGGVYVGLATLTVGSDETYYLERLTASGALAPGWQADGNLVCQAPVFRYGMETMSDGLGGAIMQWQDSRTGGYEYLFAMRMLADGTPAPGWPLNGQRVTAHESYQGISSMLADGMGGAYFAYFDDADVTASIAHLGANGSTAPGWPATAIQLARYAQAPKLASDGANGAIVTWFDNDTDNIRAQRFVMDGIVATELSLVSADVGADGVALVWQGAGAGALTASVYRRTAASEWERIGGASREAPDRLRYQDTSVTPGTRYDYRLGYLDGGVERFSPESWVEVPATPVLSLEGLRPNPSMGDLRVAFTLPDAGAASVEVLDIGGRLMAKQDVGGLGAGRHVVPVSSSGALHPGAYWVRLTHGDRRLMAKGVVLR